ncbi:glycosyltransferase involved in cell wall biosynthesis [Prosthecobacter fusiformis]|uniref:Glycosyltransferase involved in cell wall biosynthesis n=1 Tax=Prosthecobacter fusiformis TaxID=48464 RepID=A0A4R7RR82_9BACT|nr:glycosyltransferase [Prosthecobacter fusiformis]TDU68072.1 glycosyltransferase involved in cell wall biosynthesis [Prosthecobacter fusiformis]
MPECSAPCRLAFLIRDLGHGGAQRQLVTLAKALVARGGFEVTVVHFYPGVFEEELRAAGVRTACVGKRHRWDLAGFFMRLVKTMRGLRPDVIHGYLHEANLMALFLRPWCGSPKVVWGIRDSQTDADTWGVLGKLSFRLNCLLSGRADCIVANSRAGRDYYIGKGYPAERFEVVPNGIDVDKFTNHSLGAGGCTFVVIGRLHPMKDHATFLRALAAVPEARGRIIGSGSPGYVEEMKHLAGALGVADRLTWEPARDDLPAVYPTLDCVVSTSAYGEGFSNVLGEAMACGVPCLASDVGDSAWLLADERRVYAAGDAAALAEKMREFLNLDEKARRVWGNENRQRILDHFTVAGMAEKTAGLLLRQRLLVVLWITTGLGTGGAEMMLAQLVRGLTNHSHVVISLTAGGKYIEPLRSAGAAVYSLDMPAGKPTPGALWSLFKNVRQARPDILMGWMYHGCLAAVLAKLVCRARMIWNIRQSLYDLSLEKRGSALVIRALAWLSRIPEAITYNSQVSARQHEAIGYHAGQSRLIPNGFDLEKWQPLPPSAERAGGVGRFGRYTAMKDYPAFLEAAALISKDMPQVRFILAGTGVDASNEELVSLVQKLGLTNSVSLLGERDDLPALTAGLDLVVSSSAFGEGFPNVVGEAMACGVPVVATDIGDTAWVMGETGHLVPARDPSALAAACLKVLRLSPDERREMGEAGRERIVQQFSLKSVLSQFEDMLSAEKRATKNLNLCSEAGAGVRASI